MKGDFTGQFIRSADSCVPEIKIGKPDMFARVNAVKLDCRQVDAAKE